MLFVKYSVLCTELAQDGSPSSAAKITLLALLIVAMNATNGSACFVLILNKDSHERKLIFLLPSIVIESTSLDVMDAETEHSQTWPSSRLCHYFRVSASELTK